MFFVLNVGKKSKKKKAINIKMNLATKTTIKMKKLSDREIEDLQREMENPPQRIRTAVNPRRKYMR